MLADCAHIDTGYPIIGNYPHAVGLCQRAAQRTREIQSNSSSIVRQHTDRSSHPRLHSVYARGAGEHKWCQWAYLTQRHSDWLNFPKVSASALP